MAKMVVDPKNELIRKGNPAESSRTENHLLKTTGLQQIYYGAPGTGKSKTIKDLTFGESVIRTTFHPDSDYASFVGTYKPITEEVDLRDCYGKKVIDEETNEVVKEERIAYKFIPQAFLEARHRVRCLPIFCFFARKGSETAFAGSAAAGRGGAPWAWFVQRWEAVFRRERRPASLDRFFRAQGVSLCVFLRESVAVRLFSAYLQRSFYHETSKRPQARPGEHLLRHRRGGQPVFLPHVRQQVRPHPAHGQHPVRRAAGALVRHRRGLCGQPDPQPDGSWQPDGLPRQYVRRAAVRPGLRRHP